MTELSGVHILIVDDNPTQSYDLRAKLTRHGASVHVASTTSSALLMVHGWRIDVAFVPFCHDDRAVELRKLLDSRHIPQIHTAWLFDEATTGTRNRSAWHAEPASI